MLFVRQQFNITSYKYLCKNLKKKTKNLLNFLENCWQQWLWLNILNSKMSSSSARKQALLAAGIIYLSI